MLEVKTGLLALTVLATGVAGLGWSAHRFHGGAPGHRDHALMARFVDFVIDEKLAELGATNAQKQKVREVKERLLREGRELHEDHAAFREELLQMLSKDDLDAAELRAAVKGRTEAWSRFAQDAADAVLELHGCFTPEQRTRLLGELREHLAARHR